MNDRCERPVRPGVRGVSAGTWPPTSRAAAARTLALPRTTPRLVRPLGVRPIGQKRKTSTRRLDVDAPPRHPPPGPPLAGDAGSPQRPIRTLSAPRLVAVDPAYRDVLRQFRPFVRSMSIWGAGRSAMLDGDGRRRLDYPVTDDVIAPDGRTEGSARIAGRRRPGPSADHRRVTTFPTCSHGRSLVVTTAGGPADCGGKATVARWRCCCRRRRDGCWGAGEPKPPVARAVLLTPEVRPR